MRLDIDNVEPNVPVSRGNEGESLQTAMIEFEQKSLCQRRLQSPGHYSQCLRLLAETPLAFDMTPKFHRNHQLVQNKDRDDVFFVQHLLEAQELVSRVFRPVEILCRPCRELPIECLTFRKADPVIFSCKNQSFSVPRRAALNRQEVDQSHQAYENPQPPSDFWNLVVFPNSIAELWLSCEAVRSSAAVTAPTRGETEVRAQMYVPAAVRK